MTSRDNSSTTTHFEKTVEWMYVLQHLKNKFGAPLAGLHEKAGDALVSNGAKLIVIEFKRKSSNLNSESKKYPSTQLPDDLTTEGLALRNSLDSFRGLHLNSKEFQENGGDKSDAPHVFVFGDVEKKTYERSTVEILKSNLMAQRYWGSWADNYRYRNANRKIVIASENLKDLVTPIETIVNDIGWEGPEFRKYIDALIIAKGGNAGAASSDWMYATVAGVVPVDDGTVTAVMSMWEYAQATGMYGLCLAFAERDFQLAKKNLINYERMIEAKKQDQTASHDPSTSTQPQEEVKKKRTSKSTIKAGSKT